MLPSRARASPRLLEAGLESTEEIDDEIGRLAPRQSNMSPQHVRAEHARKAAAQETARLLAADTSRYALFPDKSVELEEVVIDAAAARDAGIPHGTATADEWGFAWVRKFAKHSGCAWMRPRVSDVVSSMDVMREVYFTILALTYIAQMMAPSARRLRQGYKQGKTTSALLAIYAYRRVMRDCGRFVPDMAATRGVFKGLCMRYKARWGDEAFVPERKEPYSTAQVLAIVALLATGEVMTWPTVLCTALLTAFCYACSTGARKDEWTASFKGDTYSRRASFAWVDDDRRDLPSTPEVIRTRCNGHLLRGRSSASKCDRLNIEWGSRDMWFRYDDTNPVNFAWRWQQWELAHPCPIGERQAWPAFSPDGSATPFTGKKADACLRLMLPLVMSAVEATRKSWHSCRVTIATRLMARRADGRRAGGIARDEIEGVIQTLVRWKTAEAMRIYARMDATQYADYVDMATDVRQAAGCDVPADMPEIDPAGVVAENEVALAALDEDAAAAQKAARPAKRPAADAPGGGGPKKRRRASTTGEARAGTSAYTDEQATYEVDDGVSVRHAGHDSWGILGQRLRLHYSFWPEYAHVDDYQPCRVVGYAGAYDFGGARGKSKHTYIIECEGNHYCARHTTVAGALEDPGVKARIKRAKEPRLLR